MLSQPPQFLTHNAFSSHENFSNIRLSKPSKFLTHYAFTAIKMFQTLYFYSHQISYLVTAIKFLTGCAFTVIKILQSLCSNSHQNFLYFHYHQFSNKLYFHRHQTFIYQSETKHLARHSLYAVMQNGTVSKITMLSSKYKVYHM